MERVGKSPPRLGAMEIVRGRAPFAADIHLGEALTLKVFRSPVPHAQILALELEEAESVPGVVRIFTHRDIPGRNRVGLIRKDQPVLAEDRVRFKGEAVALVAAEDERSAQEAVRKINLRYRRLPVVVDPLEAMKPDALQLHEGGNVLLRKVVKKGNVDAAIRSSCHVIKRTYETPHIEHSYLEPDAGAGHIDKDGTIVIYASTQNPHHDQLEVSAVLGMPPEGVRIIQAATGGGFGSKLDLNVQHFIALALYHLRRPVRMVFTREEVFEATTKRHPLKIDYTTALDSKGRIQAVRVRIVCDTGAYASYGPTVATRAALHATGPYEVPNVEVESICVYTNNPVSGAMRGFGVPQVAFAHESQMDLAAQAVGIDALEIRTLNALRPGSLTATDQRLERSVGILRVLEAIRPHYEEAEATWKTSSHGSFLMRGLGIGAMWYGIGNTGVKNPSTAWMEMDREGALTIYTGAAEIGQGSTTVLAQIAAEVLGVEPEEIRMVTADTLLTPDAGATSASRQTYISGNAVLDAARKMADLLLGEAAGLMRCPRERLALRDGQVVDIRGVKSPLPLADVAGSAHRKGRTLRTEGYFDPETTPLDPETSRGIPYATYAFACHLALVEVDVLTGEVSVRRVVAAHDVGKAVHPDGVSGQIYGGVAMGVGFALMEEFRPGLTGSFRDYHLPTCVDMPEVVPIIIEEAEPTGPFGAKGVGEPALIPTAPSILNAIADALGCRIFSLPASLERVLEAASKAGHFPGKEVVR
jgi:CO/xanthine dehydrogenase Mo-binding subunit